MVFVKYISLFSIFIISTYIGFLKSNVFEDRVRELKKFRSSLNIFKAKIEFTHEPIHIIFNDVSKVIYNCEKNIFNMVNANSEEFYIKWCDATDSCTFFTKDDKEIIKMFGKQLRKNRYKRTS